MRKPVGFTLIELIIAMALGLVLVAGVATLSQNATRSYRALSVSGEQIANGRYVLSILRGDLEHAGFFGMLAPPSTSLSLPEALPDPCAITVSSLTDGLLLPVTGYTASVGTCGLTDVQTDSQILVIRRTDTQATDPSDLELGYTYLQSTPGDYRIGFGCSLQNGKPAPECSTGATFNLKLANDALAPIRRYHVHVYYLRAWSNVSSDSIPALIKRWLDRDNNDQPIMLEEPLVDGIESLLVQFGLDSNGDGAPDHYTSTPASVAEWSNVVTARVNVLARAMEPSPGYKDAKSYDLGAGLSTARNDPYKRHVYSQTIRISHTSGRREQ